MTDRDHHTEKINWSEMKRKVNSPQDSLQQKNMNSPEQQRSILKARAQALTVEKQDDTSPQEMTEIVEFGLASETYALEAGFVREVYPLKEFTPLPGVPSFVLGIMNVRGKILSVIDLKKFFSLPDSGLGELNKVIILHSERMEFGILADIIYGTRSVSLTGVLPSPVSTGGIGGEYIKGITAEHCIILDAGAILHDGKIIINHEVD